MKKVLFAAAITVSLIGCSSDADIASRNVSRAADNFEIPRRVVFYNGITGQYILAIQGLCSLDNDNNNDKDKDKDKRRMAVTCKVAEGQYKKHFLGLSDNVTFFAEQLEGANVSAARYRVIFKPSMIIPDIDVR